MKIICGNQEGYNINTKWAWGKGGTDPYSIPFYVENITNNVETLSIKKTRDGSSYAPTLTIEYSSDKVNWYTLGQTSTTAITYTLQPGQKLYLRCNTTQWGQYTGIEYRNSMNGMSKIGGNIMSLLYGADFNGQTEFRTGSISLFYAIFCPISGATSTLVDAGDLLLPATTLVTSCYESMFNGCTKLTKAPYLPATVLAQKCYTWMFVNCSSLHEIRCNAINTSASSCTGTWTRGIASTGTFYKNVSKTNWGRGENGVPNNWTIVDL